MEFHICLNKRKSDWGRLMGWLFQRADSVNMGWKISLWAASHCDSKLGLIINTKYLKQILSLIPCSANRRAFFNQVITFHLFPCWKLTGQCFRHEEIEGLQLLAWVVFTMLNSGSFLASLWKPLVFTLQISGLGSIISGPTGLEHPFYLGAQNAQKYGKYAQARQWGFSTYQDH